MVESKPGKVVRDVMENMHMTDMPLETMAYQCFIAQLSNPEVRKGQMDMAVIAKRSFDAALAFREEAARVRKERAK